MRVSKLAPAEAELTTKSGAACTKTGKINRFRLLAERILPSRVRSVRDRATWIFSSTPPVVMENTRADASGYFRVFFTGSGFFCSPIDEHRI